MIDINLTPTNEACARELFAAETVARLENSLPVDMLPDVKARMRVDIRKMARDNWDTGNMHPITKFKYRELALAALQVSHQDIARQAWDHCATVAGHDDEDVRRIKADNPYTTEES